MTCSISILDDTIRNISDLPLVKRCLKWIDIYKRIEALDDAHRHGCPLWDLIFCTLSKWLKAPSFGSNSWGSRGSIPHCSRSTGVSWHWQPGQLNTSHHGTLFLANLISGCWDLENWMLVSFKFGSRNLCKITTKICEALRDTRIQLATSRKIPPLRQIRKTKGFGAVYEGQWTRYRSETDRNVTNKLCWYLLYYCTEDWSDVAVSSSSPAVFQHHLHFTVYPPKKQRKNLAPPNLLGSDTGLPLAVCLGAEVGDNLKALGIVSKLHEQDEVRKVYHMLRCHTYAMEDHGG